RKWDRRKRAPGSTCRRSWRRRASRARRWRRWSRRTAAAIAASSSWRRRSPAAVSRSAPPMPTSWRSSIWPSATSWPSRFRTCCSAGPASGRARARASTAPRASPSAWRRCSAGVPGGFRPSSTRIAVTWPPPSASSRTGRSPPLCYSPAPLIPPLFGGGFMARAIVIVGCLLALVCPAAAETDVTLWHAMGGALGEKVKEIADAFNKTQTDYKVTPVYKGNYTETMTAAIAAFRARQQPHVVQVFEVGTATMMAARGAIKPVHALMAEAGERFDPSVYLPAVTACYTTADGKMLSLPCASSTPVLYYNKDAFKKAGLAADKPPKTWDEVEQYSRKLLAAGSACGFTSQWQTWVQIENFGAWHNVPFATGANGFSGTDIKLTINDPLRVRHIENLAKWRKEKVFVYAGREGKPNPKFTTGECPMIMASAGSAGGR